MKTKGIFQGKHAIRSKNGFKEITVLLLIMSIISGCSSIGVYSNPSGAKIFIDEKDTGEVTPKSIGVRHFSSGRSYVTVEKEGYKALTERQAVDVKVSAGNIIWSIFWPPILIKNLFGDAWKGVISPRRGNLEEFVLEKIDE